MLKICLLLFVTIVGYQIYIGGFDPLHNFVVLGQHVVCEGTDDEPCIPSNDTNPTNPSCTGLVFQNVSDGECPKNKPPRCGWGSESVCPPNNKTSNGLNSTQ